MNDLAILDELVRNEVHSGRLSKNFSKFSEQRSFKIPERLPTSIHHILPLECWAPIYVKKNKGSKKNKDTKKIRAKESLGPIDIVKYVEIITASNLTQEESKAASVKLILSGLKLLSMKFGTRGFCGAHPNDPRNGGLLPGHKDIQASESLALIFNEIARVKLPVHLSYHAHYNKYVIFKLINKFEGLGLNLDDPLKWDPRLWTKKFEGDEVETLIKLQHAYVDTIYELAVGLYCVPNNMVPENFPEKLRTIDLSYYMRISAGNCDMPQGSSLEIEDYSAVKRLEEMAFILDDSRTRCEAKWLRAAEFATHVMKVAHKRQSGREEDHTFAMLKLLCPILDRKQMENLKLRDQDGFKASAKARAMLIGNDFFAGRTETYEKVPVFA